MGEEEEERRNIACLPRMFAYRHPFRPKERVLGQRPFLVCAFWAAAHFLSGEQCKERSESPFRGQKRNSSAERPQKPFFSRMFDEEKSMKRERQTPEFECERRLFFFDVGD